MGRRVLYRPVLNHRLFSIPSFGRIISLHNLFQQGLSYNTRKLTVQQYGEKFLYHKEQQNKRGKFKNSSLDRLERTFHKQIEESDLAKVLMCNLDGLQIQDFIDNLSSKYSISTIKKAYLFLQAMISFGIEMKDLPKSYDPLSIVELPDESVLEVKTKRLR